MKSAKHSQCYTPNNYSLYFLTASYSVFWYVQVLQLSGIVAPNVTFYIVQVLVYPTPQANLFTVLKEDLEFRYFNFSNFEEFNSLRDIAHDRRRWQRLF